MHQRQSGSDHAFSAEAMNEWVGHVEHVLRGIAHALNNRASAISAVVELAADPDDANAIQSVMSVELKRVLELAEVVRAVGTPRSGGSEAFAPQDVVPDALAVLRLHAGQRDRVILIEAHGAAPTRAQRWMFLRALITLSSTASAAVDASKAVRVNIPNDGDWILVRCDETSAPRSTYAGELATAMGGAPLDAECGFRIPTLAAIRRREAG